MAALAEVSSRTVLTAMASHSGKGASVCCHHDPAEEPATQYETLATVVLDLERGHLDVHAGGPCSHPTVTRTADRPVAAKYG
jgi:isopenicillin-N N-acyltransferase-like protein